MSMTRNKIDDRHILRVLNNGRNCILHKKLAWCCLTMLCNVIDCRPQKMFFGYKDKKNPRKDLGFNKDISSKVTRGIESLLAISFS